MNTCAARGLRMCSFRCCTHLFARALKAIFLDGTAQPVRCWAIINLPAGLDQERGRCRLCWQVVGLAHCCQFLVMLKGPVQVDTAALTIFAVVFIHASTLRTPCHTIFLLKISSK